MGKNRNCHSKEKRPGNFQVVKMEYEQNYMARKGFGTDTFVSGVDETEVIFWGSVNKFCNIDGRVKA